MTFPEWADKHGIESARRQFRLSDHLVFVQHKGFVAALCGNWRATEPTRTDADVAPAKQRLRDAVYNCFATEETIAGTVS